MFGLVMLGGMGLRPGPLAARATMSSPSPTPTPVHTAPIGITSPGFGAVLQGTVVIHGRPRGPYATRATLEFGYTPQGPWFLLMQWEPPPEPGPLWVWDTTTVADGTYWLRLQVALEDGSILTHTVPVQVRNYSPPEPTPTALGQRPARPAGTPTPALPTSTPWPTPQVSAPHTDNPAALDRNTWQRTALAASLAALLGVAVFVLRARRG